MEYGKIIYQNPERFCETLSGLEAKIHNKGIIKEEIDGDKDFNEEMSGKSLYPFTERVTPIFGDDLENYLTK